MSTDGMSLVECVLAVTFGVGIMAIHAYAIWSIIWGKPIEGDNNAMWDRDDNDFGL